MKGEFPDCGCHYTTDDDGIHFCPLHKAASDLLKACKTLRSIIHDQVACVDSKYDNGLEQANAAISSAEEQQ